MISENDCLHAINVWNVFERNTIGDYHDLYLKTDALILADYFEKFINTCLKYYGLGPCQYFSSPVLSWLKQNQNLFQKLACIYLLKKE